MRVVEAAGNGDIVDVRIDTDDPQARLADLLGANGELHCGPDPPHIWQWCRHGVRYMSTSSITVALVGEGCAVTGASASCPMGRPGRVGTRQWFEVRAQAIDNMRSGVT
jgi:hypothetical protein